MEWSVPERLINLDVRLELRLSAFGVMHDCYKLFFRWKPQRFFPGVNDSNIFIPRTSNASANKTIVNVSNISLQTIVLFRSFRVALTTSSKSGELQRNESSIRVEVVNSMLLRIFTIRRRMQIIISIAKRATSRASPIIRF